MLDMPDLASVASLIGDPARGKMLSALMDGRALTATELAIEAGVMPSTASSHLGQLTDASLLEIAKQGRHRYFRIASPEVARMLEMLLGLASGTRAPSPARVPLRRARVCYDHLAGEAGVLLFERMQRRKFISDESKLTRIGEKWLASIGINVATLRKKRRTLCRAGRPTPSSLARIGPRHDAS